MLSGMSHSVVLALVNSLFYSVSRHHKGWLSLSQHRGTAKQLAYTTDPPGEIQPNSINSGSIHLAHDGPVMARNASRETQFTSLSSLETLRRETDRPMGLMLTSIHGPFCEFSIYKATRHHDKRTLVVSSPRREVTMRHRSYVPRRHPSTKAEESFGLSLEHEALAN